MRLSKTPKISMFNELRFVVLHIMFNKLKMLKEVKKNGKRQNSRINDLWISYPSNE